jgi:uncharacterized protein YcfL
MIKVLLALTTLLFLFTGCEEKAIRTGYDPLTCVIETNRMVASISADRTSLYMIKTVKNGQYEVYLRHNNDWWFYRMVDEDEFNQKSLNVVRCPDYKSKLFKKD